MKKNITINMFGVLYAIDDDACQLLEQYLDNMHRYFDKRDGGAEIADDIEHRVAELLSELKAQGVEAVSIEHVRQIIQRIGNPEQMDEAADDSAPSDAEGGEARENNAQTNGEGASANQEKSHIGGRKLYRDPQDKMLGGVMSGLCRYFGCDDPLPWRILMVLLALVSFSTIGIVYLVAWALIPAANTPEDRLRMQGKPVNAQSISEEVMREANRAANYVQSPEFRQGARSFLGTLLSIFVFCVKLLVLLIIGVLIASTLVSAVFLGIAYGESNAVGDSLGCLLAHDAMIGVFGWLGVISALMFLGTLFYLMLRSLLKPSKNRPLSVATRWALGLVCLVTLISSIAFGSLFAWQVKRVKKSNPDIYNVSAIPHSVNLLARDGWKLNKAVNIDADDNCVNICDYTGNAYGAEVQYYEFEKEIKSAPMTLDMELNPAKRNVLDLKNETYKIREKRNVLKVSRTRHSKATKSSPNRAAFTVFERQTNGVQMMFKSCCIRLHKHHIFVTSIIVHMCVELKPLATFKRVAERFVLSKPFAKLNDR